MDRRSELHGWIADTRRLQRRLAAVYAVLAGLALALLAWHARVGGFALLLVGLVAVCSFWVTAAHNASHRQKLDELARLERAHREPPATGHRRWRAS
ncbi:MAG TPA: hypothetical protein VLX92_25060 [Kofleriaceae bacterium]|nr:hypothetical protein [Kofleriaceae bacterium]